jgi:hypothetical protein
MRRVLLLAAALLSTSCTADELATIERVGTIDIDAIDEASGLARSQIHPGIFWVLNDEGEPRVYAIDERGRQRGRLTLDPARNRDWEDMSSFTLDGKAYLLIADIGDNQTRRKTVELYIVEEPDIELDDKVRSKPERVIQLSYPDGPRDAESVAVDVENEQLLILSKRNLPPVLYSVPLRASGEIVAERVGPLLSLPRPRKSDVEIAPKSNDWFWQPTAMDLHDRYAVVMTYGDLFIFERNAGTSWADALAGEPQRISLGRINNAEAVAISSDQTAIYVTVEKKRPPLYRALILNKEAP